MNILYMGYFCNEDLFNRLVENGSQSSHARQQLETKLLDGMIASLEEDSLEMISYLPEVASLRSEVGESEKYGGIDISYLWCNKKSIMSVLKAVKCNLSYIKRWKRKPGKKVIFMYSANPIHVIPALLLRGIGKYKVVTLCSEVSVFRRSEGVSLATKVSRRISAFLDNSFDGYVMLSKYMNEVVNKKNRPFVVVEGVAQEPPVIANLKKKSALMYAGGLSEDNGIEILLSGFLQLNRSDIELWICGDGPLRGVVQKYADENENVHYFGVLPNAEVQRLEQEAMLLVAPRFSTNNFTKYSFPSKTIEYMSSGTPVLLTRLKGIPEEYFQYVYTLDDESERGIHTVLTQIINCDIDSRAKVGENAKEFVLRNKNGSIQAQRIFAFLKEKCV